MTHRGGCAKLVGVWRIALALGLALVVRGEIVPDLKVYSEFRRIDPYGKIVSADRHGRVREILSPPVARNAYASFRIAITLPPATPAWLYIQQNPENRFRVSLFREQYIRSGKEWIPDGLQEVKAPCFLILPEPDSRVPGQTTQSYWLDLWVPPNAPVDRVRVQAAVKAAERWLIYPMEVRIRPAVVPDATGSTTPLRLAPVAQPASSSATATLCAAPAPTPSRHGVRTLIARNAAQDARLAAKLKITPDCKKAGQDVEGWIDLRRKLYR